MKQVETFSAVCSRLDSVKLDVFQALGLVVSTTPWCKRKKKKNLLIICPYFILWFYNVCPPVCNIKKNYTKKWPNPLYGLHAGHSSRQLSGFLFRWEEAWIFECVIKLRLLKTHQAIVTSARSTSSTFVFPLIRLYLSLFSTLRPSALCFTWFCIFFFLLNSQLLLLCI